MATLARVFMCNVIIDDWTHVVQKVVASGREIEKKLAADTPGL